MNEHTGRDDAVKSHGWLHFTIIRVVRPHVSETMKKMRTGGRKNQCGKLAIVTYDAKVAL